MPRIISRDEIDFHNGQPGFEFSDSDLQVVEDYARAGLSFADISQALCISQPTLKRHMDLAEVEAQEVIDRPNRHEYLYPNIWWRWSRGRHAHKLLISNKIMEKVHEGNVPLLLHLAKTRLGWVEKEFTQDEKALVEIRLKADNITSQHLEDMTDVELEVKVNDALKAIEDNKK